MRGLCLRLAVVLVVACGQPLIAADRALLIGINDYRDQRIQDLRGCQDDVAAIGQMLIDVAGFDQGQIRTLLGAAATAEGIRGAIDDWLVEPTRTGDRVVLFYSGHGSQTKDTGGDEADGADEVLCAVDYNPQTQTNCIVDDEIARVLARLAGRNVTLVIDACHSGSISKSIKGVLRGVETIETLNSYTKYIPPPAGKDVFFRPPRANRVGESLRGEGVDGRAASKAGGIIDETKADYVLFTACTDDQRAEEIRVRVGDNLCRRGAFTWMLVRGLTGAADLNQDGTISNGELHEHVARALRDPDYDLSQTPELRSRGVLVNQPIFGRTYTAEGLGKVIAVNGNIVTINRGAQHDVDQGDLLSVSPPGSSKAASVGRIEIEQVEQFLASAKVVDGADIKVGQTVSRDVFLVRDSPLSVYLCRFEGPAGEQLALDVRRRLSGCDWVRLVGAPEAADRFVTARESDGRIAVAVYSRYGTLRSLQTYGDRYAAADDLEKRLRGERLLTELVQVSNPGSDLRIDLSVYGGQETFVAYADEARREDIRFRLRASRQCYVTLFNVDSRGDVHLLVPSTSLTQNRIAPGRDYIIPPPGQPAFEVAPPAGRDLVKAVATSRPLAVPGVTTKDISQKSVIPIADGQALVEMIRSVVSNPGDSSVGSKGGGTRAVQVRQRPRPTPDGDLLYELPATGWATAQIVVNTVEE